MFSFVLYKIQRINFLQGASILFVRKYIPVLVYKDIKVEAWGKNTLP